MTKQLYIVPEHEFEAAHGLPETLPANEVIRWQGAPDWKTLAVQAFHLRKLAIYFTIILCLRGTFALADGATVSAATVSVLGLLPLALLALAIVSLLAWLTARTTVYTITNERVVMRIGIVLSITFNLPFRSLDSVGIKRFSNGMGDIPITVSVRDKIAYLHLWPHARPWHITRAEPMLRSIADVAAVANILSEAMADASGGVVTPVVVGAKPDDTSNNAANNMARAT